MSGTKRNWIRQSACCLAVMVMILPFSCLADSEGDISSEPGVKLDHLMIEVPNASVAHELLKSEFGLPGVWNVTDYKYYISGGVTVGNVNIETLEVQESGRQGGIFPSRYGVVGTVFQPAGSLNQSVAQLDQQKIPHSEPEEHVAGVRDGVRTTFTNVYLDPFMNDTIVMFCNYSYNMDEKRNQMTDELAGAMGGALGIARLTGVEISYANETVRENWHRFLPAVSKSSPDILDAGNNVTVTLVPGDTDSIPQIDLQVRSLSTAEQAVRDRGVNATRENGSLILRPDELPGVSIVLSE